MNPKTIGLVLMLVALPAMGQQVYKCRTPEGTLLLQQAPCKEDAAEPDADELLTRQQRNAEVLESLTRQTSTYQEGSLGGFGGYGGGGGRSHSVHGPVHVRSYTRGDGTRVNSYYRSAPGHGTR
jgi:hypothetical protein